MSDNPLDYREQALNRIAAEEHARAERERQRLAQQESEARQAQTVAANQSEAQAVARLAALKELYRRRAAAVNALVKPLADLLESERAIRQELRAIESSLPPLGGASDGRAHWREAQRLEALRQKAELNPNHVTIGMPVPRNDAETIAAIVGRGIVSDVITSGAIILSGQAMRFEFQRDGFC